MDEAAHERQPQRMRTPANDGSDLDRAAKIEVVARAVHEAVRAYQGALGEAEARPWSAAEWEREATLEAVELAIKNPTPGAQHEEWCASKRRAGWRFGPIKDESKKTHPSLVPFEQLSATEQRKDAIIISISQALKDVLGLEPLS